MLALIELSLNIEFTNWIFADIHKMISALTVHLLLKFARINSISAVVEARNNEI